MTFKVGDRVKVKTYEEFKRDYPDLTNKNIRGFYSSVPLSFTESMNRFCDKEYIIMSIGNPQPFREPCYQVTLNAELYYYWSTAMLTLANTPKGNRRIT